MASILKVDTLTGVSTAGSISVTGEGNSTTTNLQQGLAKVWTRFNGTSTIAVNDSLNVSGLTDHGTGDYQVNFTNNMGNINYANTSNSNNAHALNGNANSADNLRVGTYNSSTSLIDSSRVMSDANGDLA